MSSHVCEYPLYGLSKEGLPLCRHCGKPPMGDGECEEVVRLKAIIDKAEMACLETDPTEGAEGNLKRILGILTQGGQE